MSNRNVTLDNIGDRVEESVRVYLHSGMPSALLMRIAEGALQAAREISNTKDAAFVRDFAETLLLTRATVRKQEVATYEAPDGWQSVG